MAKAKRDMVRGLGAPNVIEALRRKFPVREYAFIEQVANGTGFNASRWCDAIALGLWPSRGMPLFGFEVKVSRNDWKKELEQPEKAESIASYCDHWYIGAPRGLVDLEEVPPAWGLIEVNEDLTCRITKTAPKLEPKPLSRAFIAAALRRSSESMDAALKIARREGREEGAKDGSPGIARALESLQEQHRELVEKVQAFEKASGLEILFCYQPMGKIGEAVKLLLNESFRLDSAQRLQSEATYLRMAADRAEEDARAILKIRGVEVPAPQTENAPS